MAETELTPEQARHRAMIEAATETHGMPVQSWGEDEEGLKANLGRARATEDDEDSGIFSGDEGALEASVVGAQEFGNERVCFTLTPEAFNSAVEVEPDEVVLI